MSFFEQTNEDKVNNTLWCERYRPTAIEDYIGNESLKARFKKYIDSGEVPHLLLYGRAGTGKTTAAKMLVNAINCDYLLINASDENNVDTIRTKVKNFAASRGFSPFKIAILDEFDFMSANAQAALRNLMETFSTHCRFILTCNYVEKIIEPIQSRCQVESITPPSIKDVCVHLARILNKEGITFNAKDVLTIVEANYPDIRKCINTAQRQSSDGELVIDKQDIIESDFKHKVIDILGDRSIKAKPAFNQIRKLIADNRIQDFTEMYRVLYDNLDQFATNHETVVILLIADAMHKDSLVVDKEINFVSLVIQILGEIR